ncbi:GNAT superfamily N-acetyltransferase [Pseudomonas hunanensis]|uniref:GNAT superfamily N-acetyltransferase n=1 Tax=Pseudomonas hunanensis TaxID=1247546 RepID=A0ACC6K409_9PSED|nr:GNAT family N-acetyltransferase [Pseudomonas hunanensis]MDR6713122.1 GNAT superfamily N-acetyltransferase [Pseudomonas hunanensis]
MTAVEISTLTGLQRRLLDYFYRQHGSRMRSAAEGVLWVARVEGIIAGLSLSPVADGQWLTGLLVDPQWRGRGVAGELIEVALAQVSGPTWLFCHPDLEAFYQRLAFSRADALPEALAMRLARYQRSKRLIALVRDQSSLTSSPGNSTSV